MNQLKNLKVILFYMKNQCYREFSSFEGKISKNKKGTNTREKIRSAVTRKFDSKIISIATDELIVKEV